jgi:hypothetical protein
VGIGRKWILIDGSATPTLSCPSLGRVRAIRSVLGLPTGQGRASADDHWHRESHTRNKLRTGWRTVRSAERESSHDCAVNHAASASLRRSVQSKAASTLDPDLDLRAGRLRQLHQDGFVERAEKKSSSIPAARRQGGD